MVLGCHGQQTNTIDKKHTSFKDSIFIALDSLNNNLDTTASKDNLNQQVRPRVLTKEVSKGKLPILEPKEKEQIVQTKTAKIWNEEQIAFLKEAKKILLFHVRITDIGSRKLELDSELETGEHQEFINTLLNEESYPSSKMVESSDNANKFQPKYQMLIEAGEERLTLMFDEKNLKMVVASLYGREKFDISSILIEQVEKLKKGE